MSTDRKSYQFIHPIATNEEADIYLCQELENEIPRRSIVLKILQSNWSENQEAVRQFQADIHLLERLRHRNIANIYDVIAIRGRTTILMEQIEGIDLKRLISLMKEVKQRIPLRVSLQIISSVARALDEAYNMPPSPKEWPLRVMHGNLKPSNIMLQPNGLVRILDFGLVRSELGSRESSTRELQYEQREYMAPERLFFEPQSPAVDIYSLSMTLFEMIAGKPIRRVGSSEQEHDNRIHSYCKKLLSPLTLSVEFKEALYQLLTEGLAYNSNKRPSAEDFSKKASMLSQAMNGIDSIEWSERAVAHFCEADSARLQGGLQGRVLGEDTQIYTKRNDDSTIRDEVDTAIMRRGAQMELSMETLSQDSLQSVTRKNDQLDEEIFQQHEFPSPQVSERDHFDDSEETFTDMAREPVFDNSKTISSADREYYRAQTSGQLTKPDVTKQELSHDSGSFVPPMVVNPQAMVIAEEEESSAENFGLDPAGESTAQSSKKGIVLIGLSLLGFFLVLAIFGYIYSQQGDRSPTETEIVQRKEMIPEPVTPDNKEGIVVISRQKDAKKLEVRCGSERWKGTDQVVIPLGEWKSCMIVGRDMSRQKVFSEIEELKEGTYTCFASGETCQWEE